MVNNHERDFMFYFPLVLLLIFCFFMYISKIDLDHGGFLSLGVLISFLTVFFFVKEKSPRDFIEILKDMETCYALPLLFLSGIIFVGLWLTIRVIGYYSYQYLFVDKFQYIQYQIFVMISYILATRLCLTLFNTIRKDAKDSKASKDNQGSNNRFMRSGYIDAAIQAVIISIITVLPNYANADLLGKLGDTKNSQVFGFLALLITLTIILVLLLYSKKKLITPDNSLSS